MENLDIVAARKEGRDAERRRLVSLGRQKADTLGPRLAPMFGLFVPHAAQAAITKAAEKVLREIMDELERS